MKLIILGGDGYLGWPSAMYFAARGYKVLAIDNYLRRKIADETSSSALMPNPDLKERAEIFAKETGHKIEVAIGDCTDYDFLSGQIKNFEPSAVVHYAEQPSAPYSMLGFKEARLTLDNNLQSTFNLVHAVLEFVPECHIVKLGTMGEYGTPPIDIEEGWLDIEHKGKKGRFLYPRSAGSLYHTTKILDTDLLWFYVRMKGLKVTDLMQGPVYGLSTEESDISDRLLPNFHYDDIFGTVLNRFLVQAVAGVPLTVYGKGGQTRGYLNIRDTLACVELALQNEVEHSELRILNQFTEVFSVNELADKVKNAGDLLGLDVQIKSIENPRKELEEHDYNVAHTGLLSLGLEPTLLSDDILTGMLGKIISYKNMIDEKKIMPRVKW